MRRYVILCGKDTYNVLGLVRTLGEAGMNPILVTVGTRPRIAVHSKYLHKIHIVRSIPEGINLIVNNYSPTTLNPEKTFIIAAGDDLTTVLLDDVYPELHSNFYFYNASGNMRKILDKEYQSQVAEKYGFKPLKIWRVNPQDNEIPEDIVYPVMTKAPNSYGLEWKDIMFICHNKHDLLKAYTRMKSREILLQEYVEKKDEQSYSGISSRHGLEVMIAHQNNQVYNCEGHYTPRWILTQPEKIPENDKILLNIKKIIKDFGFEGIFEFEFILDKNDELRLLEVNLRNTVLGYASTVYGLPLVTLWCSSMTDGMSHVRMMKRSVDKHLKDIIAISECYDFDLMRKGMTPEKNHRQWMRMYKSCSAKLYRGRHDFIPFLSFMIYKKFHKV